MEEALVPSYTREPNKEDFLAWAIKDENLVYNDLYYDYILPLILDLEQDDFFGTEGFDKRFGQ